MKNFLRVAVLCFFLLSFFHSGAQFRPVYKDGDNNNHIQGLSFYTPKEGFVAFRFFAGYTTDSGYSFVQRPVTTTNLDVAGNTVNYTFGFDPFGIKAFNKDTLLYFGNFGLEPTILYSANGGLNWKVVYHEPLHVGATTGAIVYDVQFPQNAATGYAVHDNAVLKTTDRGKSWRTVLTQTDGRLSDIDFTSDLTGYVIGENRLLKTYDGGASWQALNVPGSPEHLEFVSAAVGYIVSTDGMVYKTTNGGSAWTAMNQNGNRLEANHVQFVSETTGYAAGHPYGVYMTTNSCKNWELLKGSNVYSGEPGDGFNELFFYNNTLAWVGGDRGYLMKTDNAGGTTYPVSLWNYSKAELCSNGRILLENYSASGYTYAWYRNDTLIATTYNASYAVVSGMDTISLVVSNGVDSDTMTRTIYAAGGLPPTLTAVVRDSTVCTYQQAWIDIPNSEAGVEYNICRVVEGSCIVVQKGNGGLLALPANRDGYMDSTITYRVSATRYSECGPRTTETYVRVHFKNLLIPMTIVKDTICMQQLSKITIANSRMDYRYWVDTALPVMGTGGPIDVYLNPKNHRQSYYDHNALQGYIEPGIYVEYVPFGCKVNYPYEQVRLITRDTEASFDLMGYEYFTGDTLRTDNTSKQATRYKWTFDRGAAHDTATQLNPPDISYSTTGQKLVMLYSYTKEGCVDSASRTIEIFSKTVVPSWDACRVDSLTDKRYFRVRDMHEDEYGNMYLVGGMNPMNYHGRYGLFALKLDKDRNVVWQLTQNSMDWSQPWSSRHHLVLEQVVSDAYGYSYMFGHNLNNRSIKDGTNEFPLPSASGFLMKVSPKGKIVWVKTFYNKPSAYYFNFSSGSLLMGKNNDLYLVTQLDRNSGQFFMNDQVIGSASGRTGMILHLDEHGRLLDKSLYPALYTSLRDYYSSNDDFDYLPKGRFDQDGRLVFYTELNPAEITGNQVDDASISFDLQKIQSALLYFDTAQKKIVEVRPVYRLDSTGARVSAPIISFALDPDGSYYSGYMENIEVLSSTQYYDYPASTRLVYKPRGVVAKYAADGVLLWKKMMEGLQPYSIEAANGALFAFGGNFPTALNNVLDYHHPNVSRIYAAVKKPTAIHDPGSYDAVGVTGPGSVDMVLARFHAGSGAVETLNNYGNQREQNAFVLKKGQGGQLYFSGQGNLKRYELTNNTDTASTLFLYKTPPDASCTSAYQALQKFVKFDHYSVHTVCIDSTVRLNWSQHTVERVRLLYSTDYGASYRPLADNVDAAQLSYTFRHDSTMNGRVLFKIEDQANAAFSDTLSFEIAFKPVTPVITAHPSSAMICGDTPVVLTVDSTRCPTCVYTWHTGVQGATLPVNQLGMYEVKASNTCGTLSASQWVSSYGVPPLTVAANVSSVCQGGPVTLTASGGQSYKWLGPGLKDTVGTSVMAYPSAPGKAAYTVTMEMNGCVQTKQVEVSVTESPAPTVLINYSGCPGNLLTFQPSAVTNGGTAPVYTWYVNDRNMGPDNIFRSDTLKNGTTVYCLMTSNSICAFPKTVKSNTITINCLTTALPRIEGVESFVVAPNPSNGVFTVRLKTLQAKKVSFRVLDNTGRYQFRSRIIVVSGTHDQLMDLRHLASGTYYLETNIGGKMVTEKIVIHK